MKQGFDFPGVSVGALIFNNKGQIFLNKRSQNCKNSKGHWEAPLPSPLSYITKVDLEEYKRQLRK